MEDLNDKLFKENKELHRKLHKRNKKIKYLINVIKKLRKDTNDKENCSKKVYGKRVTSDENDRDRSAGRELLKAKYCGRSDNE